MGPGKRTRSIQRTKSGFTLLELIVVVAIAMVLAAIAIPAITNSLRVFTFRSSVAAFTGAIQSTRYQAIYHGCPYQLAFSAATTSYTVASQVPPVGSTSCLTAMGTASAPIPLPGRGVKLNTDLTLLFHPSGQVVATVGTLTPVLTYSGQPNETITISAFGRTYVTP